MSLAIRIHPSADVSEKAKSVKEPSSGTIANFCLFRNVGSWMEKNHMEIKFKISKIERLVFPSGHQD
jgi:hypothetical protein